MTVCRYPFLPLSYPIVYGAWKDPPVCGTFMGYSKGQSTGYYSISVTRGGIYQQEVHKSLIMSRYIYRPFNISMRCTIVSLCRGRPVRIVKRCC